ncbi:SpdD-like protein [Streptomyces mauvecolor]
MFRPRIPVNPVPISLVSHLVQPTAVEPAPHPVPATCDHHPVAPRPTRPSAPSIRLTGTGLVVAIAGGAGIVLVVGAVLVSMLLVVAITSASVTACALVIRSLMHDTRR